MARKCNAPGCGFYLPDRYPSAKCPWHLAPGRGPVKIAAALTIAAAGFGGGFAYKKFRRYLDERKRQKQRGQSRKRQASEAKQKERGRSATRKRSSAQKRPSARKQSAAKSKRKQAKGTSETEDQAAK